MSDIVKQSCRSRKTFIERLLKLPLLNKMQFGDVDTKSNVSRKLDGEILLLEHKLSELQLRHFRKNGEIGKLLKACGSRFNDIVKDIKKTGLGNPDHEISIVTDWFAFDPSAYALTYELDDDAGYIVVLATPMLCGVYSNDQEFNTIEDVATFLDSILIHELAHCVGSMKHDAEFKDTFNRICELENVKPII